MECVYLLGSTQLLKPWRQIGCYQDSLVVQWLRLWAPIARDPGSIPGQGTGSHVLQLRPGVAK